MENKIIGIKLYNKQGAWFKGERVDDGYMFKDDEAFETGVGICYIAESQFDGLEVEFEKRDGFIPEQEIVSMGYGETKQTIIDKVLEYLGNTVDEFGTPIDIPQKDVMGFVNWYAENLYRGLGWACVETELYKTEFEDWENAYNDYCKTINE